MGRPSSFKPEFIEQAKKLSRLGATDREVAEFFEVSEATVHNWKHSQPGFLDALKLGKEAADKRVEQSLYRRATGYSFDAIKIMTVNLGNSAGSEIREVPYVEHVPPDTTACIFWLKNRLPALWRDKRDLDVTHRDSPLDECDTEALRKLAESLRQPTKSAAGGNGEGSIH